MSAAVTLEEDGVAFPCPVQANILHWDTHYQEDMDSIIRSTTTPHLEMARQECISRSRIRAAWAWVRHTAWVSMEGSRQQGREEGAHRGKGRRVRCL